MAISTPTQIYSTVYNNADIADLKLYSLDNDPTAAIAILDTHIAAGMSLADAAVRANPYNTQKLVTYNVVITGTAVEADIEAIILDYTNTLALGADVDASVMSDAILALATVATVPTFELSLDADPTGETIDLVIGAAEVAYTTAAAITFTDAG